MIRQPACSTHLARGLTAALLAVVLLSLACAGSDAPESAPSNLTADQRARLHDFAEKVEAVGDLRPVLPAYVPPGLDPYPYIIDGSEKQIVFEFSSIPDESSEKTAVPLYLMIAQAFEPSSLPFSCDDGPSLDVSNLEDYDLSDRELQCVHLDGRLSELDTIEQPDSIVDHNLSFELDDLDIYVWFSWKRGQDVSRETEEQMKKEPLRVALSMTAP